MRNLTEIALKNRVLVWYFVIVTAIGGIFAFNQLGRMEDPSFTIRTMVISAAWPGATADEMQQQVTDKLERRIQDIPGLDHVTSETWAGKTVIYVELKDDFSADKIRPTWRDLRNFCEDIKKDLPDGVYGPYYNDRFDDVFGSIYAVTGEGFSYEEKRQYAEKIRRQLLHINTVQKVELLGEQTEKIYVEVENAKLSALGIAPTAITNALAAQDTMTPAASVETESDTVYLRVSGVFSSVEDIKNMPINAGGKIIRLGDIATVERRYAEPSDAKMFFNGEEAVGIAVSMIDGGNILSLGEELNKAVAHAQTELPLGLEINKVSDQPQVVKESIETFTHTLFEAIVIVLAVSFLSLGLRTGIVVACCIPLVLAGTFVLMFAFGIDLHKVSLGSLIISLGLLVDDAIIAVEMMSVQLERGLERFDAACYAFRATAKPMLTGTLITCAGFVPVAFSQGMASEFCQALFPVISISLVLSWIVSVMVAPLFGYRLIKVEVKRDDAGNIDPYQNKFYKLFRKVLAFFLEYKKSVILVTAIIFVVSLVGFTKIPEEFFPPSTRPELLVEFELPQGSSLAATEHECRELAKYLDERKDDLENYSYYVGQSAPRFVLTVNPKTDADNLAQFVIVAKDSETREKLADDIRNELADKFPNVRGIIQTIQTGPPADYPIMLRVSGYDVDKVKEIAGKVADIVAADPKTIDVSLDWGEKAKAMRLELDQDKLRALGVTSSDAAKLLYTEITGASAAQFYTGDRTIDIDLRMAKADRQNLENIKNLPIYLGQAGYVPLSQIAKISYTAEDTFINRRNLLPTITVRGDVSGGTANDATQRAFDATKELRDSLPYGYSIEVGGALEDSEDSTAYLLKPVPAMIFVIMTLLIFQLRSAGQMVLTVLTAPLGLIGVTAGMLLTGSAMGFVAELGILALFGMIIRNSVILIDQIQKHMADGENPYDAVIDSAVLRFRPIMLTAAAAILGMLPLMTSTFWKPLAVAIASGLLVATVLTLLVLPAMYAVAYNVKKEN